MGGACDHSCCDTSDPPPPPSLSESASVAYIHVYKARHTERSTQSTPHSPLSKANYLKEHIALFVRGTRRRTNNRPSRDSHTNNATKPKPINQLNRVKKQGWPSPKTHTHTHARTHARTRNAQNITKNKGATNKRSKNTLLFVKNGQGSLLLTIKLAVFSLRAFCCQCCCCVCVNFDSRTPPSPARPLFPRLPSAPNTNRGQPYPCHARPTSQDKNNPTRSNVSLPS